jgi:alginate O-acetyltransferase complex protein AlgI
LLFNSYTFIFSFLPISVLVFYLIGSRGRPLIAAGWLVAASLFFYGWWNPIYLVLIAGSICANYVLGALLIFRLPATRRVLRRALLLLGIGGNLAAIAYFKYANFFLENVNGIYDTGLRLGDLALPLGISFFTFTQISFLLDSYRGQAQAAGFVNYALFVTFFPHLIAGPIVYHRELVPQFVGRWFGVFRTRDLAIGLAIFTIGLTKKVAIADRIAAYANPVFDAAAGGATPGLLESWIAALAYALQLYFDFSGYSDMAIGLARMFGIRLPINFDSPFKASGIIEFWKRWHMTLSRFINTYVFIPVATPLTRYALGSTRPEWLRTALRVHVPLLVTFVLLGLWHGAGWTFVVFGLLHGFYLIVNHAWRGWRRGAARRTGPSRRVARLSSTALTFAVVVIAFVPFRATGLEATGAMLKGMSGMSGVLLPEPYRGTLNRVGSLGDRLSEQGVEFGRFPIPLRPAVVDLALALVIVWLLPNTQQIMGRYRPAFQVSRRALGRRWWQWRLGSGYAVAIATLGVIALLHLTMVTEFLYFQF